MSVHVFVLNREFAFSNRLQTFSIVNGGHKTIDEFFADAIEHFNDKVKKIIEEYTLLTLGACFVCEFVKTASGPDGPENNAQDPSKYKPFLGELDFTGIEFPVKLVDITKFERQNNGLAINVYMFNGGDKKIRPIRLTKEYERKTIHLLMLSQFDSEDTNVEDGETIVNEDEKASCWGGK